MTARLKPPSPTADLFGMRMSRPSVRAQQGFTLVEVLVASFVLITGLLGTFVLIDGANRATQQNSARIGAANLAREIVEHARSLDYALLAPDRLETQLRAKPGLEGQAGAWVVRRRNTDYTVSATVCVFDDPKDGLAASGQAPTPPCPTAAAGSTTKQDANPDDFRRVDVTLAWTLGPRDHTSTQHTLIPNPSGSLGPRVKSLSEPTAQIPAGTDRVDFTATTDHAATLTWTADDARSSGSLIGPGTSWSFSWMLGTAGEAGAVRDGRYIVTVQARNSQGVSGDAKFASVSVNRLRPATPTGFGGGRNTRYAQTVDLRWSRNPERDVIGYRLYRVSPTGRQLVFQTERETTFTDVNAPTGTLTYELVALDREDLENPASAIRESVTPASVVVAAAGDTPPTPTGLAATLIGGAPKLTWTQPTGGNVIFFRIYRAAGDQSGRKPVLADRYAYTLTNDPTWTDPSPAGGTTTYWVSAVDQSFNESFPSDPIVWSSV